MTRLETPTEVMNDITSGSGAAERKRSRPTYSSLDIKVPDGMKLTTTRMPRRSQPQQQQQQQQQRIISSRPTRAQRGGFPPKSYDFISDLDDLTEAQIRSAFAQDPELAAAAAVAENDKKRKRSPYYRKKDGKVGSLGEHPQHLRAMMEAGIPVKQWIILLLLLGAGLYQLRKVLVGPPVEKSGKKNVAPKKQASAQKAPKKAGKPKGKKTSAPAKNKVARSAPTGGVEQEQNPANQQMTKQESPSPDREASSSVPKLLSDEKAAAMTAKIESVAPDVEKDKAAAAQSADSKKPKSAKKKKKAAKKTEAKVSSSVEDGKPQGVAPTNGSAGTDTGDSVHLASAGEGDGWQTVGKGSVMDKAKDTNGSEVPLATKNAENDQQQSATETTAAEIAAAAPATPKETLSIPATQKETLSIPHAESAPKRNGKGKNSSPTKPKPAKASNTTAPTATEATFTDDDAALALKLQEEEEKMAKEFSQPTGEDTWAEVAPKRGRRKSAEPLAGPAATAAW